MKIEQNEIIELKKPHPCKKPGAGKWRVLRTGADFRLECMGCGRQVMMKRSLLEKQIVKNNP
ncbi:MAG: DUF951 domain-containing protein [Lachnospiraceae bacterium]|nr:DUF951 domain-containing protein [Lachnospiraceae bacterium]